MDDWKLKYRRKFGKNLRNLIEKKNTDIITVASIANLENKQIYRIINAENEPKITTVLPIAKALNIHPKELFDFEFDHDRE